MKMRRSGPVVGRVLAIYPIALVVVTSLTACSVAFGFNPKGYSFYAKDLNGAWQHTASFKYTADPGYWKSPAEFESQGGGDCKDYSTDLMYYLGSASQMYVIKLNGHSLSHAIVFYHGAYIEPQIYGMEYASSDFTFEYALTYDETMAYTTLAGFKGLAPKPDLSGLE